MKAIAIVGAAGRFPGARDLDQLWERILQRESASTPVPEGRWPVDPEEIRDAAGRADRLISTKGCYLELPVGPGEPSHRLAEEVGAEAWKNAGADDLDKARVSTILANIVLPTEESSRLTRETLGKAFEEWALGHGTDPGAPAAAGPLPVGGAAEALASFLGLGGGGFTLDAACASSLFALHLACLDLEARRVDAVLAGGVSLPHSLYTQVGFTQLKALSPSGRCLPFDSRADGLVVGEGAGVFVLQRLEDAVAAGRTILGVIRGIGLSNDVGGSLLSPEQEGQLRSMRAAYDEAGWSPDEVDLVECHGTGTPRGDEVELSSLRSLFGEDPSCVIGSVKSNVGHLLTAAGAAGLSKVLLGLREKTFPPTAGFSAATALPALRDSRLKVLEEAAPWPRREGGRPRRGAVSGFGFGGTNAHLLVEEWIPPAGEEGRPYGSLQAGATPPLRSDLEETGIAIVGMSAYFGRLEDLASFREAIFQGQPALGERPPSRWATAPSSLRELRGAFIESLRIPLGRFRIPPKEIPTLLPQHLLALETAVAAAEDAGIDRKTRHLRAGAVVGLELDLESTSFHLRWLLRDAARRWAKEAGEHLGEEELDGWARELLEELGPSLDASRTLGALGGVVASRIARELVLGGPSMTVSAGACSGLRAIEVASRLLAARDVDWMIAGAVDLAGDLRRILSQTWGGGLPFDAGSDGPLPGEGAAAIVLKRVEDAIRDGDEIYAVVRGIGAATGKDSHVQALHRGFSEARIDPKEAGLVEAHGSGSPDQDREEALALHRFFPGSEARIALGSAKAVLGHTGAAAGLASVVKTALCISGRFLPPHPGLSLPLPGPDWEQGPFHFPRAAEPWLVDGGETRVAGVSALEGQLAMHLVLQQPEGGTRSKPARAGTSAPSRSTKKETFGPEGDIAFVFPGTGSHFLGMGGLFASFPEVLEGLQGDGAPLRSQMAQALLSPWRRAYGEGWEKEARDTLAADPQRTMLAQVAHGIAAHELLRSLGVQPDAVIGYSLGETTSLLATGVWPERDEMFRRTLESPLFRSQLFGAFEVARRAWGMEVAPWAAAIVRLDPARVREGLRGTAELLIVNAPGECVIGGKEQDLLLTGEALGAEIFLLPGVPSVHCSLAREVEAAYRMLHDQPTRIPDGIRVYSASFGKAYLPTRETTVESIVHGAIHGFDFSQVIEAAYADGVRTFVEVGPGASCTRMIRRTLGERRHLAVSISQKDRDPLLALTDALEALDRAGIPSNLGALPGSAPRLLPKATAPHLDVQVGRALSPVPPHLPWRDRPAPDPSPTVRVDVKFETKSEPLPNPPLQPATTGSAGEAMRAARAMGDLALQIANAAQATAASHSAFLESTSRSFTLQQAALSQREALLSRLGGLPPPPGDALGQALPGAAAPGVGNEVVGPAPDRARNRASDDSQDHSQDRATSVQERPAFDRDLCMEFAVGSLANVLGPAFAEVDTYPTRVRLPDEPLMLVDRIVSVEGTLGQLGPGRCVTEHDVKEGTWYLDGGRAPVCISVESGQADLFLCAYLGIDLVTKGERVYRLLDAKVVFHRDLAKPGETIRYDIRVKKFIQQGTTHLLFFEFDGTIDGAPFITMREGCAGFFSRLQLDTGRGIVGALPTRQPPRRKTAAGDDAAPFTPLLPMERESLDPAAVEAIRDGDLERAFGSLFQGIHLPPSLRLPTGRMRLVDRIVELDPTGGRYGMGRIIGEADVEPDAWFLTCHFVDDMVMPGTLMYECCLHTLRVFLLRMGWVVDETDAEGDLHYAPVVGAQSELKCRGQVTQRTRQVRYRIDIKEIGYDPEPYVIADASMLIDGFHAVEMEGMSIRLAGTTQEKIETAWRERLAARSGTTKVQPIPTQTTQDGRPLYDERHILAFAEGSPVAAFGERYLPFESGRRMARLPAPPFSFIDEIVPLRGEAWKLEAGAEAEAKYLVPNDAWYFKASRQETMPYAVLLEVALQPCGWLAAWLGSALVSKEDLFFRNLEGDATLHRAIPRDIGTLRTQVVLESVAPAGGMILQAFRFQVESDDGPVFSGHTRFGFFPEAALAQQAGIGGATLEAFVPGAGFPLPRTAPLHPSDPAQPSRLHAQPAGAWQMLDRIDAIHVGQADGFISGSKDVREEEWFFHAHFPGDPVMPGSLGIEAFLQLLRVWASRRWEGLEATRGILSPAPGNQHTWAYRGQVLPPSARVEVQAKITGVSDDPHPTIVADGLLAVDGKVIYTMKNYSVVWEPGPRESP